MKIPGLGAKIRTARREDSRSLKAICKLVGMTRTNWYRIEAETQTLPLDTLRKIEGVLGVEFGVEFTGVPNMPSVQPSAELITTRVYPAEAKPAAEQETAGSASKKSAAKKN